MGPTMITCFYNKDSIYFIDPNDPEFDTGTAIRNYNYQNGIYKFYNDDKRTSDEARFTYGEICFLVDTYYGLPGREYLHKDLVKYHDLDKALLENSDMTRIARTYLLSTDISKYFAGMLMLDSFLSDAGHSVTSYGVQLALSLDSKTALKDKVLENLSDIGFDSNNYAAKRNASQNYRNSLRTVINNMGFVDCSYMRKGNTLMYTFDSFNFDIHDWNKYYKNPNIDNLPKDALGNFKKMLEEHKDNSSIKNIVINISNNGGGYGDLVVAFLGLMGCETYQHMHDMINDNYVTTYYDFDANFDGVFDEKDKNVQYNFRFAILCSARSFSCGNLLPALAKESGIMILGDKSGGGSCAVIDATSAEGFYIRLSCQNHLAYLNGEEVEYGVPADYTLVVDNGDDTYDFSNFYNMEIMSSEIDKFYI